ncbi:hypothetical protein [Flavobacterium sp. SORGH_AS_0622]|uniref:hypothetical protein n=1 Tax=Flavobacterium sp. SORGH_AS_0622 TaxID=3041772 RepID=UPI00278869F3|nr:hypothetical protein [Flavobacterium sp. SORGH_AS_0622]MDQ1164627.1 methyltransferase-like protein [Flavobacterium sp. SORGH_AS_0622]
MPEKSTDFFNLILRILSENHAGSFSLEELTKQVFANLGNYRNIDIEENFDERQKQSLILDHLIKLDDLGLVFLNPETDKSSISNRTN